MLKASTFQDFITKRVTKRQTNKKSFIKSQRLGMQNPNSLAAYIYLSILEDLSLSFLNTKNGCVN